MANARPARQTSNTVKEVNDMLWDRNLQERIRDCLKKEKERQWMNLNVCLRPRFFSEKKIG